ncbi:hypothetical protein BABINDRAFT_160411 [Babjeviella inositovora NRRL Y-12698]|uniref:Protein kinase domain-containing protein n=1 Tax=Babjeviella inositovora NRRL Y-12698 TaxID=984486 RepID=A0A1E3QTI3_9ASCO|nr:uncharacterized protein BABINDRAFT_160411 [Babjeviella inositovora NRRL Y-12698]ODQ80988.1 hypothetical protein BABINDRAFT_160411 [Babjeviella inositovora NRRL Y-12698]
MANIQATIPKDIHDPPTEIPLRTFANRYQVISNLGNGSFGSVTLAKFRGDFDNLIGFDNHKVGTLLEPTLDQQKHNNSLVAIKTMNKKLPSLNDYTRVKEIKFILSIPSHPNLVQIYELFIDSSRFQLHIVMECMNQNLYQLIKARKHSFFSPATLKSILSQILDAIRHIHKYDYFHRDIKPENILVMPAQDYYGDKSSIPELRKGDNYIIKLADYGLARHVENTRSYTSYVSTRWYRSPEILLRKKWYSRPVDIWAFGTVAVEIATFRPLFPGSNELDQTWRVLEVLGSPDFKCSGDKQALPLGGSWDEAQPLAAKLGFHLPVTKGVVMDNVLPVGNTDLADVVDACLTWNPAARATVDDLCRMSYFKGTVLDGPYQTPAKSRPKSSCSPGGRNSLTKNLLLAGIPNMPSMPSSANKRLRHSALYENHSSIPIKVGTTDAALREAVLTNSSPKIRGGPFEQSVLPTLDENYNMSNHSGQTEGTNDKPVHITSDFLNSFPEVVDCRTTSVYHPDFQDFGGIHNFTQQEFHGENEHAIYDPCEVELSMSEFLAEYKEMQENEKTQKFMNDVVNLNDTPPELGVDEEDENAIDMDENEMPSTGDLHRKFHLHPFPEPLVSHERNLFDLYDSFQPVNDYTWSLECKGVDSIAALGNSTKLQTGIEAIPRVALLPSNLSNFTFVSHHEEFDGENPPQHGSPSGLSYERRM